MMVQVSVIMNGQDASDSFTGTDNGDGSYSITGKPPFGMVFTMDDFNHQTAIVTINGQPARQVICDSLSGQPGGNISITAQVLL
jgi:hypothetical protein